VPGPPRQRLLPGAKRGPHTGRNPTDRGKKGTKRHVVTDANGIPLAVKTGPANQRDDTRAVELVQAIPPVPDEHGRVRARPEAAQADRGYGFPWLLVALWLLLGGVPLIAPRGSAHGSGLGKTRYVVERTLAWFASFRRIRHCYERSWHSWQALNELAACVICANRLRKVRQRRPQAAPPGF